MKAFIATTLVALAGCSDARAPNPWVRWRTEAQVRASVIACGKVEIATGFAREHQAEYRVEGPRPFTVFCAARWDHGASRISSMFVSVNVLYRGRLTLDDVRPFAEFILRELPPEPRAMARRIATHRAQRRVRATDGEFTAGAFTIEGGFSVESMGWNLHVVAR